MGKAIVVGAGMGGLAAAIELACHGHEVRVLEQHAAPGGKLRQIEVGGTYVDAGPTVLTMPWVFEELFALAGSRFADHVRLRRAQVLARHAWADGARLDLHAERTRSEDAIGEFSGAASVAGYRRFCEDAARIHALLRETFLQAPRPTPIDLARRHGLLRAHELFALSPFETLWSKLGEYFADPRLRQLFGRYATYCGSSPFLATATLMLVAHVEQEGVWYVQGGMIEIARELAGLAGRCGVELAYGARVKEVILQRGAAAGVTLASGERLHADRVVVNADPFAVAAGSFGSQVASAVRIIDSARRSLSAITWCVRAEGIEFPLLRHNVFFSDDYAAEFRALASGRVPEMPTTYVCAQDREDAAAPIGRPERLLCLINAPALADTRPLSPHAIEHHARDVERWLARHGLRLKQPLASFPVTTPSDYQHAFGGPGGALYGEATHGWRASFRRPGARTAIPGLYLAGGGTHPGPGVPMAALSGRQAAAAVVADMKSGRSRASGMKRA